MKGYRYRDIREKFGKQRRDFSNDVDCQLLVGNDENMIRVILETEEYVRQNIGSHGLKQLDPIEVTDWKIIVIDGMRSFWDLGKTVKHENKKRQKEKWEKMIDQIKNLEGKKILCFDLEMYERDDPRKRITEVGMCVFTKGKEILTKHLIIEENRHLRNGVYCADNRDNFMGTSECLPRKTSIELFNEKIKASDIVVAHSKKSDLKFLEDAGEEETCKLLKEANFFCTQEIHSHVLGKFKQVKLVDLCKEMGVETKHLHNAGNDAHFTLICFRKLCSMLN